jgi:acetyl-CoA carboxylase carboxyl transferase subunit beta
MSWFENIKAPKIKEKPSEKVLRVPDGLWVKCVSCGEILQSKILKENQQVCPECQHHFRMGAWERIAQLTRDSAFDEIAPRLKSSDPLQFQDQKPYPDRLAAAARSTGQTDAIVTGRGLIGGMPTMIGAFEFKFMGGSMGAVVGEKIARLFETALDEKIPAIIVSSSGGARMQEGILSLMQLAKTSALIADMRKKGLPYISVLTDPTTGGVAASFAMLGDVIIAEPNALIGFAGPRVIGQTIRQELPPGFQRAEFLLKHGFVDLIVPRKELPQTLAQIIKILTNGSWQKSKTKKTTSKQSAAKQKA